MLALYYKRVISGELIKMGEYGTLKDMYADLYSLKSACLCGTYIAVNDKFIWQIKVTFKGTDNKHVEDVWKVDEALTC